MNSNLKLGPSHNKPKSATNLDIPNKIRHTHTTPGESLSAVFPFAGARSRRIRTRDQTNLTQPETSNQERPDRIRPGPRHAACGIKFLISFTSGECEHNKIELPTITRKSAEMTKCTSACRLELAGCRGWSPPTVGQ